MGNTVEALILDMLEWIGPGARPYPEVLEAWRTSCPRLPVWEDANDQGFVELRREAGLGVMVAVSPSGEAFLRQHRPGADLTPRPPLRSGEGEPSAARRG